MKRIGALICFSTMLFASTVQARWEYNWLLGASVGYFDRNSILDWQIVTDLPESNSLDDDGVMWGLFGGYQAICDDWLYGLELNVNWYPHTEDRHYSLQNSFGTPGGSAVAHYDHGTAVGLTVRVGYQFTPYIMPYVRAGAEASRDELIFSAQNAAQTIGINASGERTVYRFVGGLGVELPFPVLPAVSFRMEYNYHSKGKSIEANGAANDGTILVQSSARPYENAVMGSFVFNFI